MENQRVRIADIAEELGLSTATVSNVIHGRTNKVSAETVKRVQQLIEERQYIPSMAGMLLARNDSKIIGVMINNHTKYERRVLQDPFISAAVDYLSEEIEKSGYFMMIKTTSDCRDIIRFASMWNMVGAIMVGFCGEDYEYLRSQLHIPMVVYDGYFDKIERYANVTVDDFDGGMQMGKYLIGKGHRKILCIADNDICMDNKRYMGLASASGQCGGVQVNRMLVPMKRSEREVYYTGHLEEIMSYSAVFAVSDVYAAELIGFLSSHGIRVPQDISVAGFDDSPICGMITPKLTTIHQDNQTRARAAVELLLYQKEHPDSHQNRILPVYLVERESVQNLQR